MKIGLALSGGGFRASVFHLGVLARLAESHRLEEVAFLSTVSGGSLCAGLVYTVNGLDWPSGEEFLAKVLPRCHELFITQDLQRDLIWNTLLAPWRFFETHASELSRLIRERWGVTAALSDLPESPRWMINATCYETGKNWRFERFRMGDYAFGYSYDTHLPLSDAMASSAGFPGLIGPLTLATQPFKWFQYTDEPKEAGDPAAIAARKTEAIQPAFPTLHLWDGGVYDNHGLEGLADFIKGWKQDIQFLIVSDGAGRSKPESYQAGAKALMRLATGIMMDQVRSLRARAILERIINHQDPGGFLQIGKTCAYTLSEAGREAEASALAPGCLSAADAQRAETFPTVIRRLTQPEFELLFRHGFEVADYTLYAYHPQEFSYIGYNKSRSREIVR